MPASLRQPNFAMLLLLAWLAVASALLLENWANTAQTLFDTDDAMRLVQLRAFLSGQGWFDLHQPRLQPPLGYDTHWSRLIDAGLAGLFLFLEHFTAANVAERLMRVVWPLLWLLPTMAAMVAIAWRIAGQEAALVALLLALVGTPAYQQFTPGRIDHHNVQIALLLLTTAATIWSDRLKWTAWAAGMLTGLALAIGFESLPYLVACGAALAVRFVFDRTAAPALRAYGLSLAASVSAAFLISVDPGYWTRGLCDAIAINTATAFILGGLAISIAGSLVIERMIIRGAVIVMAASTAMCVSLLIEPRCLGGPYAMVDPAVWPIWLADVRENQPLIAVLQKNPLTAAGIATFPAVALLSTLALVRVPGHYRDFGFLTVAAIFLLSVLTMIVAIRAFSYAMWFGMPLVAAMALRLFTALRLRSVVARFVIGLMLTPMVLSAGAITIANAAGLDDTDSFSRPESRHCFESANYAPVTQLPPGLIVTDVSYGPFLLALTPHSVMAAPYHRLSAGIVTAHHALTVPPDEARDILARANATYVLICGPRPPTGLAAADGEASLWGRLRMGRIPPWLEPIADTQGRVFAVYRVKPQERP